MRHLSVKKLLSLAFGTLAVLVLFVSIVALIGLNGANDRFAGYVNGAAERERLASEVRNLANRRAIGVRDMVVSKSAADRDSARTMAVKAHQDIQVSLKALKDAVARPEVSDRDRALVDA